MHYGTVGYGTVPQYGSARYDTRLYGLLQFGAVRYSAAKVVLVPCGTVRIRAPQHARCIPIRDRIGARPGSLGARPAAAGLASASSASAAASSWAASATSESCSRAYDPQSHIFAKRQRQSAPAHLDASQESKLRHLAPKQQANDRELTRFVTCQYI